MKMNHAFVWLLKRTGCLSSARRRRWRYLSCRSDRAIGRENPQADQAMRNAVTVLLECSPVPIDNYSSERPANVLK